MKKYKRLKELTVLYVEDEIDVREEISEMLELKVGKLFISKNGKEALDIYNKEDIDIIITDIQMPIMDGMSMIEIIRETDESIPVIITTAFNETSFLKRAIDLHVDKYITKPIDFVQLISVLNRSADVVFQRKEIDKRDRVIKTILDMHPYYSLIVDEVNIKKINLDLLAFLDSDDSRKFTYHHIKNDICIQYETINELTNLIISLKDEEYKNDMICLKEKGDNKIKYVVKPYFFESSHLFLIAFFEYDKVSIDEQFLKSISNPECLNCIA